MEYYNDIDEDPISDYSSINIQISETEINQLEKMFITKLSEKYRLIDRDLKKAFGHFDTDKSGLLETKELIAAIKSYLNGVDDMKIRHLCRRFDPYGEGRVSYQEFTRYLIATGEGRPYQPKHTKSSLNSKHFKGHSPLRNAIGSTPVKPSNSGRPRRGVTNPRINNFINDDNNDYNDNSSSRYKQSSPSRYNSKMDLSPSQSPMRNVNSKLEQLSVASGLFGDNDDNDNDIEYNDNNDNDNSYDDNNNDNSNDDDETFTWKDDNRSEITNSTLSMLPSDHNTSMETKIKVFVRSLSNHLLGKARAVKGDVLMKERLSMHAKDLDTYVAKEILSNEFRRYVNKHGLSSDTLEINRRGFLHVMKSFHLPGIPMLKSDEMQLLFEAISEDGQTLHITALQDVMFPPKPMKRVVINSKPSDQQIHSPKREKMLKGPIKPTKELDLPTSPSRKQELQGTTQKYQYPKSKTTFNAPVGFDKNMIKKSLSLPPSICSRSFVFGLSLPHANSCLKAIKAQQPIGLQNSSYPQQKYKDTRSLVYASAGVVVVHELETNKQSFFAKHTDNVSCLCVSKDGTIAASGQVGRRPSINVWFTESSNASISGDLPEDSFIISVGNGFFERAVNAVEISYDNSLVIGIGEDDKHKLGIWDIATGLLIAENVTQNGLPPQIKGLSWSPSQQFCSYISRDAQGQCDVILTTGENHIRFWALKRPVVSKKATVNITSPAELFAKTPRVPKELQQQGGGGGGGIPTAKSYTAGFFVPTTATTSGGQVSFDALTAGTNGYLYLWSNGLCSTATRVDKSNFSLSVTVTSVIPYAVICTAKGTLKVFDARTLLPLTKCKLTSSLPQTMATTAAMPTSSRLSQSSTTPRTARSSVVTDSDITILGMTEVPSNSSKLSNITLAIAMSNGVCEQVMVAVPSKTSNNNNNNNNLRESQPSAALQLPVFYYHTACVNATTVLRVGERFKQTVPEYNNKYFFATVGSDRYLMLWDAATCACIGFSLLEASGMCVEFNRSGKFISVGLKHGGVAVYVVNIQSNSQSNNRSKRMLSRGSSRSSTRSYMSSSSMAADTGITSVFTLACYRKDAQEEISDIKFSPRNDLLAVGSHDNYIYVYACPQIPTPDLSPVFRLKGHSSYITHIDWSTDAKLLRSTCGGYELLYWDTNTGKQFTDTSVTSDASWATTTVTIGFNLMGIWPPCSDGTDINSLDVSRDSQLVCTAGDNGEVQLFNYPCIAEGAGVRRYGGHASFVTSVRFLHNAEDRTDPSPLLMVSTGGEDLSTMLWSIDPLSTSTGKQRRRGDKYENAL